MCAYDFRCSAEPSFLHNPRKHFSGVFHTFYIGKEYSLMTRSTTRCAYCPAAGKYTQKNMLMHPLFVDETMEWPPTDPTLQLQARALHEAIAPYLCIADLRRLATSGDNIQAALKNIDGIPEEVQALVSLLQVLLAPCKDERITRPADLAPLLMLDLGHLHHAEFCLSCL